MQIIADLEGTTRGPYGGCVGYFSFNGILLGIVSNSPAYTLREPIAWLKERR